MMVALTEALSDQVAKALCVAIALAPPGTPMHAQIMAAANALDDAINADDLAQALAWAQEVHPAKTHGGAARIEITWEQWNSLRRALGLREQPEPRMPTLNN